MKNKLKAIIEELYDNKFEVAIVDYGKEFSSLIYFKLKTAHVDCLHTHSISKEELAMKIKKVAWDKYHECIISGYAEFGGFAKLQIAQKSFDCLEYDDYNDEEDMIFTAFYWLIARKHKGT